MHNLIDNSCKYGATALTLRSTQTTAGVTLQVQDNGPGVSGGTIVFILGFYERFLDALHNVVRGSRAACKDACTYLLKLGVGWAIGMGSCVVLPGISGSSILLIAGVYLPTIQAVHSLDGPAAGSIAGAVHAGIWRAGGRGYIHQCYPRRAAKSTVAR